MAIQAEWETVVSVSQLPEHYTKPEKGEIWIYHYMS